jgi:hypothetical protein
MGYDPSNPQIIKFDVWDELTPAVRETGVDG